MTENNTPVINELNIITHNIRRINAITKQQLWFDYCIEKDAHIISITETMLAESTYYQNTIANQYYNLYTANNTPENGKKRETSPGTAIALKKILQKYIHNIQILAGYAIAIDLFLPQKNKVRVISIYLLPNNKSNNQRTQDTVIEWIKEANKKGIMSIVMGDFNHDEKKKKCRLPLFNFMEQQGIVSSIIASNISVPT